MREELNGIDANENKEKLLKKSRELDILINEYLKK
ncbi:Spo0E family sporulation regulatory protein-aspartic acid phosphatase [Fuchsiella alkaliacetigena]|nr:Spo0E family sporulation regulatory protein-aspartic acid phosphatase [Fuchsiella alkaliacetigena]